MKLVALDAPPEPEPEPGELEGELEPEKSEMETALEVLPGYQRLAIGRTPRRGLLATAGQASVYSVAHGSRAPPTHFAPGDRKLMVASCAGPTSRSQPMDRLSRQPAIVSRSRNTSCCGRANSC